MDIKPTYEELELTIKELEKKLFEHDRLVEEFERIFNYSLDMIGTGNLNGYFTKINTTFGKILGYTEKEFLEKPFLFFVHDDDINVTKKALMDAATGKSELYVENRYRCKDGSYRWIEWKVLSIVEENKFIAVGRDISERMQMEEELRESENRFKMAGKTAYDLIYEWDVASDSLQWFGDIDGMLGYKDGEISRDINAWLKLIHPKDVEQLANAVEFHRTATEQIKYTYRVKNISGAWRYWDDHALPLLDSKGKPYKWIGVCTDITERKNAEEALLESEKKIARLKRMESLGLMAGGIAHDLNNILSGVVSYPDLLLLKLPEDSPLRRPLETIKESGERAANVVSDLITIARGIAINKKIQSLNDILNDYLKSVEHQKCEERFPSITFKVNLESSLMNINCFSSHIKKTLMNLCYNAAEAIEGSGTITISTTNIYLDEPLVGYEDISTGEYVLLTILDSGSGISQEDLDKIFEPFYTKKIMGRTGTGLGLSVVWNTIQDHDGYINVKSSNEGTVFELYFPATRDEESAIEEEVKIKDYSGNGEKILIVDDEKVQIEIASALLTSLGYSTEAVSSGEEAIGYLKDHSVDLILLDMIMPQGLSGCETYKEIIKIHPAQKAIIASGYAKTEDVEDAQKLGAGQFIKKPYTINKIGVAIKEELLK